MSKKSISFTAPTPYSTIDLINDDVNYIVYGKGDRRRAMQILNSKFPPGSIVGITLENSPVEIAIQEWGYIKHPTNSSEYIIGGRGKDRKGNECVIKPVRKTEGDN